MMMNSCTDGDAKLACQYTYQVIGGAIQAVAPTTSTVTIMFPHTMRAAPTATLLETGLVHIGFAATSGLSSGSAITAQANTANHARVTLNGFSALTANTAGFITTTNFMALDAELL